MKNIAIIMAGGKGTRLSGVVKNVPKAMAKIGGKPLLSHQIEQLANSGVTQIYIVIGHLGECIKQYYKEGDEFGVKIRYVEEKEPLGTAGGLHYLRGIVKDPAFLIFGDIFFSVDLCRFMDFHYNSNASISLFVHPNSHPYDSDLLICNDKNRVIKWDSKNNIRDYDYNNCVNSGLYILNPEVIDSISEPVKLDFEKNVIMPLIERKENVFGYKSTEYVKDAGTEERYNQVAQDYSKGITDLRCLKNKQKCIFLDRDGTINKLKGFISSPDAITLEDYAVEAIKTINNSEYLAVVITNQPVIARGECSIEELANIHRRIETLLGKEGAYIDAIYFCPHHPEKGFEGERVEYKINCDCRKPNIGLIKRAEKNLNIDLEQSYFIGDTTMDIMTAKNVGIKSILVRTGEKGEDRKYNAQADFIYNNLFEAVKSIINKEI